MNNSPFTFLLFSFLLVFASSINTIIRERSSRWRTEFRQVKAVHKDQKFRKLVNPENPNDKQPDSKLVFDNISSLELWKWGESISGSGSEIKNTHTVRECLGKWIEKYSIKKLYDVSGDGNWQHLIPGIHDIEYRGYDVSTIQLSVAREKNKVRAPKFTYHQMDLMKTIPPKADLWLLKEVLQHLSFKQGTTVLQNIRQSGTRYLAVTSYQNNNSIGLGNIPTGWYYTNNVYDMPIALPPAIESCACTDADVIRTKTRRLQLLLIDLHSSPTSKMIAMTQLNGKATRKFPTHAAKEHVLDRAVAFKKAAFDICFLLSSTDLNSNAEKEEAFQDLYENLGLNIFENESRGDLFVYQDVLLQIHMEKIYNASIELYALALQFFENEIEEYGEKNAYGYPVKNSKLKNLVEKELEELFNWNCTE
eukprot:g4253.t1